MNNIYGENDRYMLWKDPSTGHLKIVTRDKCLVYGTTEEIIDRGKDYEMSKWSSVQKEFGTKDE